MQNAAENLGGTEWSERANAVGLAIAKRRSISEIWSELVALHKLLHLEFVNDLESVEAACFMAIHPDSEIADNARQCAETLDKGLRAFAALACVRDHTNGEAT